MMKLTIILTRDDTELFSKEIDLQMLVPHHIEVAISDTETVGIGITYIPEIEKEES